MVRRVAALWLLCVFWWGAVTACAAEMMLPQVDDGRQEVRGWWFSEKLDGVRGYWDGAALWSKNGRRFSPPPEFTADWPPFPLDGELWGGRGTFETTAAVVARREPHAGWLDLRFGIFDVPEAPGGFAERLDVAQGWFAAHPSPFSFVIPQHPVRDRPQLRQELHRVELLGGEGLIVRDPAAPYVAGRTALVLKVKSRQDDEAIVVAHLPGKGRLAGMLGALLVELPNGIRFRLGCGFSDDQRRRPPPPGTQVTFRHQGYHLSGIPRFPVFLRVRSDCGL